MERYKTLNNSKDYIVISGYSLKKPENNNLFLFVSLDMKEICSINANQLMDIKKVHTGEIVNVQNIDDKFALCPKRANSTTFNRRNNICWEFFDEALFSYASASKELYMLNDEDSEIFKLYISNSEQSRIKEDLIYKRAKELQTVKKDSVLYMHWLIKALTNITDDFSFCSSTREYVYGKIMNQINYHGNNILHPWKYSLNTSIGKLNELISELNVKVYVPEKLANRLIDNFDFEKAAENFVDPQKKLEDFFPSTYTATKI